jgi:hypothetical protein
MSADMTRPRDSILEDLAREETRLAELERTREAAQARIASLRAELDAAPAIAVAPMSLAPETTDRVPQTAPRTTGAVASWGALDEQGLAVFFGHGLEDIREERKSPARGAFLAHHVEVFSDLGQWLLKVVLSHRLPSQLQMVIGGHPVDRPVANAARLAALAQVSVPRAARIIAALRKEHFVDEGAPLEPIRGDELIQRWSAVNLKRALELRACWVLPERDGPKQLGRILHAYKQEPGKRACLGLFAASDLLGFPFVKGVAPHLYLEDPSPDDLESLGLRLAESGEGADVFVRRPIFPESVFRGAQPRAGVPVADVVQCWLDVSHYPARGPEMAEHLYKKVIGPSLRERRTKQQTRFSI